MSDIAELFALDPLLYTKENLYSIIAEMRKSRTAFAAGNMKAGKAPSAKTKKEKVTDELKSKLKISL